MTKLFYLIGVVSLLMLSCSKDNTEPTGGGGAKVTVDQTPINFTSEGGTRTIVVTADGDWSVSGTKSWCSVSPESGKAGTTNITITVIKEDLNEDRNATLSIGDKTLTVTQKKIGALILTQDKYDIPMEGNVIEVEVSHNIEFEVILPFNVRTWIEKVDPKSLTKTQLQFKIAENPETDKRYGEIYIKDKNSELCDTIRIYQVQKDALILTNNNQTFGNAGGNFDVELRTNIDYDIILPEADSWIKYITGTKAMRVDNPKFQIEPLTSGDNRETMIIFKNKANNLADTLNLCQIADGALFLMKSIHDIDHTGRVLIIKLRETEFETKIIEGEGWIEAMKATDMATKSGLKTDSIKYRVYSNSVSENRFGRILVTDKVNNITDTVKISQTAYPFVAPGGGGKRALWAVLNSTPKPPSSQAGVIGRNIVLVGWRFLPSDTKDIGFDVYRNDVKINDEPIVNATSFQDKTADRTIDNTYYITASGSTTKLDSFILTASAAKQAWITIPLNMNVPEAGLKYEANDAAVGDLDGDGMYEIVIKRMVQNHDQTDDPREGTMLLEAYKLDGTFMWRVDMGANIRQGAHYGPFIVYDFDGDGRAEVAVRTAEETTFGDGIQIGDTDGDGKTNYEAPNKGKVMDGPEFLSVIDGLSGRELARTNYIGRGPKDLWNSFWGDDWGNRMDRFLMGVGNFDGQKASILICRGYYKGTVLEAWDFRGGTLTKRWRFDTAADNAKYSNYEGQGNHNLSIGDIDNDGHDEIVYGSCSIDHDGRGMYSTGFGHGDAMHLGDFDPTRPGLEVWQCHERTNSPTGATFRDARTGRVIFQVPTVGDNGRAMIADIDPNYPGCEMWSAANNNVYSSKGQIISDKRPSYNMAIWWDGDLSRDLLDGTKIDSYTKGRLATFYYEPYNCTDNNSTKANPCFYGDIIGDWREEIIYASSDHASLKVFMSDWPSEYRFPYLMSDHHYSISAALQNVGYNQPNHTGYYIGNDLIKK